MDLPHIIITGEAGHGKDTVGAYLAARYGYDRTAFADPLKQEAVDAYAKSVDPVPLTLMHDAARKELPTPQLALKHCHVEDFVELLISKVYQKEDQDQFKLMKVANEAGSIQRSTDEYLKLIERALGPDVDPKYAKNLARSAEVTAGLLAADPTALSSRTVDALFSSESFSDDERMSLPRSPRRVLQPWGTEYRREMFSDTYWVDKAEAYIDSSSQPVYVSDGRFHNECDWAVEKGLQRLHVVRPGHNQVGLKHASEDIPAPTERTIIISNDRMDDNFASLHAQIDAAMESFAAEHAQTKRRRLAAA